MIRFLDRQTHCEMSSAEGPGITGRSGAAKPPAGNSLIYRPATILDRLQWSTIFTVERPIEVELGSGDGSFLARWAAARPDRNFLGVERLVGRLKKLDRKGQRAGLNNLRLIRFEAAYLLRYLLPPGSVSAIHIYFPDPWPKRRHQAKRLVNTGFPELAQSVLIPGGIVWLRTDSTDYFQQMQEVFAAARDRFAPIETPSDMSAITTDFERGFNAQGIPTCRAGYQSLITR